LRCARLLDRLAFATQEIPIVERLSTAWQLRCLQWVVRRRLDAETWKLQDGSSISSNPQISSTIVAEQLGVDRSQ
jgi:hypothetical protein